MDPATVTLLGSLFAAAATAAPGIFQAIAESGAKDDAEAIQAALEHVKALPIEGGADGAWQKLAGELKAGGTQPTATLDVSGPPVGSPTLAVPADPYAPAEG